MAPVCLCCCRWSRCQEAGLLAYGATKGRRRASRDALLLTVLQVDEESEAAAAQLQGGHSQSGLTLQKGFRRRTWTGPAWMDNVTPTGHVSFSGETAAALPQLVVAVLLAALPVQEPGNLAAAWHEILVFLQCSWTRLVVDLGRIL